MRPYTPLSRTTPRASLRAWVLLAALGFVACATPPALVPPPSAADGPIAHVAPERAPSPPPPSDAELSPIPVFDTDPTWGSALAPITIVTFSDFQCPFCSRGAATLHDLEKKYGPERLRVVWKNLPLAFHDRARPAAEAAMAVFESLGHEGFWTFHDRLFANQRTLGEENLVQYARDIGCRDGTRLRRDLASHRFGARVERDEQLAQALGVTGTPAFFVNGVAVSGARPAAFFEPILDAQEKKAAAKLSEGTARAGLYAALVRDNFVPPRPEPPEAPEASADETVYAVPLGDSPVRGAGDALVTLVGFGDFQCPFCRRASATIESLAKRYGGDLRFVWKHEPLPFHPHAEVAAVLAEEARKQRGAAAFWTAHDALFAIDSIDSAAITRLETKLGLRTGSVEQARKAQTHARALDADESLAEALDAEGTPHFFINGRRLVGAQPESAFVAVIDAELAKAKARVARGVKPADLYRTLVAEGNPGKAWERRAVPAPSGREPSRGGADARVIMTQFSDFQCPFCRRVEPTIDELLAIFGPRLKVVWRNLPLPMHADAPLAAEAALEAHRQKGNDGFWAMHKKLLSADELGRETLVRLAGELKLDVPEFERALTARRHKPAVDADAAIAAEANIRGTPAFVINGLYVSGAQPLKKIRRVVERALAEAEGRGR